MVNIINRILCIPFYIIILYRYGTGNPETVFVERKTHRESWTGDLSVKERFVIKENQVQSLLAGTFDLKGCLTSEFIAYKH